MRTVVSERTRRFQRLVRDGFALDIPDLVAMVRAADALSPLARVAALRVLIAKAPIEVTLGAVYLSRRRFVREHYGV